LNDDDGPGSVGDDRGDAIPRSECRHERIQNLSDLGPKAMEPKFDVDSET